MSILFGAIYLAGTIITIGGVGAVIGVAEEVIEKHTETKRKKAQRRVDRAARVERLRAHAHDHQALILKTLRCEYVHTDSLPLSHTWHITYLFPDEAMKIVQIETEGCSIEMYELPMDSADWDWYVDNKKEA